ncbi:unnamed protein product [Somion occarium]|uniref:Uncharacterized protein n=1 Tax=Somion occarium TaxID=3059160 RepID=A0ABP1E2L4_9APHY
MDNPTVDPLLFLCFIPSEPWLLERAINKNLCEVCPGDFESEYMAKREAILDIIKEAQIRIAQLKIVKNNGELSMAIAVGTNNPRLVKVGPKGMDRLKNILGTKRAPRFYAPGSF